MWLKENNCLYSHLEFNENLLYFYPENGPLPEIEENVTQDDCVDAKKIFLEETAGFSEHPAECVTEIENDDDLVLYLEKNRSF